MTNFNAQSFGAYGATWNARGYSGRGSVEQFIDCHKGRPAIVAGSARSVFTEIQIARHTLSDPVYFAANDVGMFMDQLDHWCSLHSKNIAAWKSVRWLHQHGTEPQIHSIENAPDVQHVWELLTPLFALSGYFAMQLAWIMGCSPIILCGIRGDQWPRFFEASARADFGYGSGPSSSDPNIRQQLINEMNRLPEFKAAVRSMSGWTKTYFGGLE